MYVVLSIEADNSIVIHDIVEKFTEGRDSLRNIAYSNVGCHIENKRATEILIYKNTPGYVYGKYKTLVKTLYLIPYDKQASQNKFTYNDVMTELKEKIAYKI